MLDIIALVLLVFSLPLLGFSLTKTKKESLKIKPIEEEMSIPTRKKQSRAEYAEEAESAPVLSDSDYEPRDDQKFERRSMPSTAPGSYDRITLEETPPAEIKSMGGPTDGRGGLRQIERKASLIYWERMCLEEEFDLIVSLHRPEFKVATPDGASVHESEATYKLPTVGHVRVIPVCSGCNISPAYRDMKVSEMDNETRAEFKVLPLKEGEYDLNVEFQLLDADGQLTPLGKESTKVTVQKKPIELNLKFMNLSVSRRVPAFFSMCGSFFGLSSFVLARFGYNLNEGILAWSATISTGVAGAVMILLAVMLLFKGLKPLMNEIDITLKL
ncbi:MAG: hypothetical protein RTU09_10705 [Candidatus Thorarchaeota archaeon]